MGQDIMGAFGVHHVKWNILLIAAVALKPRITARRRPSSGATRPSHRSRFAQRFVRGHGVEELCFPQFHVSSATAPFEASSAPS
jgi:hypothetical protein